MWIRPEREKSTHTAPPPLPARSSSPLQLRTISTALPVSNLRVRIIFRPEKRTIGWHIRTQQISVQRPGWKGRNSRSISSDGFPFSPRSCSRWCALILSFPTATTASSRTSSSPPSQNRPPHPRPDVLNPSIVHHCPVGASLNSPILLIASGYWPYCRLLPTNADSCFLDPLTCADSASLSICHRYKYILRPLGELALISQ